MKLSNVLRLTDDGEWIKTSDDEASILYPDRTVRASEGRFKCGFCHQHLTFTYSKFKLRCRYFKHSRAEQDKQCQERSEQLLQIGGSLASWRFQAGIYDGFQAGIHDLPLRIRCSHSGFKLELGFLQVPSTLLRDERKIHIRSYDDPSWEGRVYSTMSQFVENDGITYLSVGKVPRHTYSISIIPFDYQLRRYWPDRVEGISPYTDGALFHNHNGIGKKLPKDSDVLVGRKYTLLARAPFFQNYQNINIELICQCSVKDSSWYVYEVTATSLEYEAIRFFERFGCHLTESAVTLVPIWPAYIKDPFLLKHCSDDVTFFLRDGTRNDVFPKILPDEPLQTEQCNCGKVFTVKCRESHQVLSAGRTTVLLYSQIWDDPLDQTTPLPNVRVTDLDSREIPSGKYTSLPTKKTLVVNAPFDGYVVIKNNNAIIKKQPLKSNQEIELDKLKYEHSVEIFQGLDLVWSVCYVKPTSELTATDTQLLYELEHCYGSEVEIPHSLGSIAQKMGAYPKTKLWLYKHIKSGKMSQRAYKILISHFSRRQIEN